MHVINEENNLNYLTSFNPDIGDSCFEIALSNTCDYFPATRDILISTYPNCTFQVEFSISFCNLTTSGFTIFIDDFEILDHNCPEYDQDLLDAELNNSLEVFVIEFNKEMYTAIERNVIENGDFTGFACGELEILNVNFILNGCVKYCLVPIEAPHQGGGNGFTLSDETQNRQRKDGKYVLRQVKCGSSCCKRSTIACFDEVNMEWDYSEPVFSALDDFPDPSECDNDPGSCAAGSIGSTICLQTCDEYME
jgi:hypothetical protein